MDNKELPDFGEFFSPAQSIKLKPEEKKHVYECIRAEMKGSSKNIVERFFSSFHGFAPLLASVFLIAAAGGSTVVLASDALPGDFLYPLKLATESVSTTLHWSTEAKIEDAVISAEVRLDEAEKLEKKGDFTGTKVEKLQVQVEKQQAAAEEILKKNETSVEPAVMQRMQERLLNVREKYEKTFKATKRDIQMRMENESSRSAATSKRNSAAHSTAAILRSSAGNFSSASADRTLPASQSSSSFIVSPDNISSVSGVNVSSLPKLP